MVGSQELLNIWSTNDLNAQALLRRSNAFNLLKISLSQTSRMIQASSWLKTLERPRMRQLVWDLHSRALPLVLRRFLGICAFESVVYTYHYHNSFETARKWVKLVSEERSVLHGTTSLNTIHFRDSQWANAFLPSTLTHLEIQGSRFDLLPFTPLHALTSLKLNYSVLPVSHEPSLSPHPLLLHGVASMFPNITSLDISGRSEGNVREIFELPPKVAQLTFSSRFEPPIFIWPKLSLESIKLAGPFDVADPVARLLRSINFYSLRHFCPDLTYFKLPLIAQDSAGYSLADWKAALTLVGQTMMDQLLPPGCTLESLFQPSKHLIDATMLASIIYTLPPLVTSLHVSATLPADLGSLLTALSRSSPPHLSSLTLDISDIDSNEEEEAFPMPTLPSTITRLKIKSNTPINRITKILPSSLTMLDAEMTLDTLLAIREKMDPSLQIRASTGYGSMEITSDHLALLYPPAPNAEQCPPPTHTERGNTLRTPSSSHSHAKMGPYGPNDERDATGNWSVTYSGLRNALARWMGRTTASLLLPRASEWPYSVASVNFTVLRDNAPGIQLDGEGGSLKADSTAIALRMNALPAELPKSLKVLEAGNQRRDWSFLQNLPRLAELNIPTAFLSLASCRLPIGLRILSTGLHPKIHDFKLRYAFKHLPFLEKVELDPFGIICTAPNLKSSSFSLRDALPLLQEYLRPNANTVITFKEPHRLTIETKLFPRTLTSLDLLGRHALLEPLELPISLTCYRDIFVKGAIETLPLLQELHSHSTSFPDLPEHLPQALRSLSITVGNDVFRRAQNGKEAMLAASILPCASTLHTLVAPDIPLNSFTNSLRELAPDSVLPNLTRLVINPGDCVDTDIQQILQSNYSKLRRLTLTSSVRFTGQLVENISSTSSTVSFQTLFYDTRMALLSLLESRYRKHVNKARSTEPSQLQKASKDAQLSPSPSGTPSTPQVDTIGALTTTNYDADFDTLTPELNIVLLVVTELPNKFVIPSDTQHLSLKHEALLQSRSVPIDYQTLDASIGETAESRIRDAMNSWPHLIANNFIWSSITNYSDLKCLVDVEYDSRVPYTPGDFFQYSTLKRLKIHAPIAVLDDEVSQNTCLKYGKWQLPPGLTHLVVTKALRSFEFVYEDSSQSPSLSIVELPQAIWQHEDMMLSSIVKVVVHDCHPRGLMDEVISKGCEVVFT